MKTKKNRQYEEVSYWQSMADILVGLLLSALLIVLLLILYLMRVPEEEHVDDAYGDTYVVEHDWDAGVAPQEAEDDHHEDYPYRQNDNGGGGGGYGDGDDHEYDDPDPGVGEELGGDRTAVFVQIVDGETQSTIKRSGVEYELYSDGDALQTLSVYYPVKTDYNKYQTNQDGVFYLPEKILLGDYYLHGLSTIPGYDVTDRASFTVDESRDWDDPFVVTVELYPSRSIIRVQMKDQESGKKLGGGAFNVVAESDIVTLDGTTRYHAGQIVDTIVLDETGYGESVLLYLGQFRLEQTVIPEYYASVDRMPLLTLQRGSQGSRPALTELSAQRTTMRIFVSDALYTGKGLAGASFTLSSGDGSVSRRLTTDEDGWITLNELKTGTTYHLRQTRSLTGYSLDPEDHQFRVDSTGRIDGEAVRELTLTNAIVRLSVGVEGKLFSGLVSDMNVALYTGDGTLVKSWNSSALEEVIEGLEPGEYRVVLNGKEEGATRILVEQTEQVQNVWIRIWTTSDIGALAVLAAVAVGVLVAAALLIRKKQRRA